MHSREERSTKWRVRGLIAGPALPKGNLKLNTCRIRRIGEQESRTLSKMARQRLVNPDFLTAQFGSPDVFSAELPLAALVYSKYELSVIVDAPNALKAHEKAEEEAHKILGALTFTVGIQKYRFYPSVANKLRALAGSDTRNYMSTGIATATIYESDSLRAEALNEAKTVLALGGEDKVFERAFGFLQSAWRLASVPLPDPAINKAILSNCFLVLEAVADAVTKEWRKEHRESVLSKQEAVIENLQEELHAVAGSSQKVRAVREAYKELQRAELYFQDLKLETAGLILTVEERFVSLAKDLGKLRNRHLGHAGSTGSAQLEDWIHKSDDPRLLGDPGHFGKGELPAMAYLRAYVAHVGSR
jgi:hypothetical protein